MFLPGQTIRSNFTDLPYTFLSYDAESLDGREVIIIRNNLGNVFPVFAADYYDRD